MLRPLSSMSCVAARSLSTRARPCWNALPQLSQPRHDHAVGLDSTGSLVVAGGMFNFDERATWDSWRLKQTGKQVGVWEPLTPTPPATGSDEPRGGFGAAMLGEEMLIVGGYSPMSGNLRDARALDLSASTSDGGRAEAWQPLDQGGDDMEARSGSVLTSLDDGTAVLFGGFGASECLNDFYRGIKEQDTITWKRLGADSKAPPPRSAHAMAALGSSGVLLFGGFGQQGTLGDLWQFKDGVWDEVTAASGDVPEPRSGHSIVSLGEGIALLFGGVGDGARAFDDIHVYYADQCRWQRIDAVGAAPTARYNHRAIVANWNGARSMLVTGGFICDDEGGHASGECFGLELEAVLN